MTDPRSVIAEVLMKHSGPHRTAGPFNPRKLYSCNFGCDWYGPNTSGHAEHVAAKVDEALGGLTRETNQYRGIVTSTSARRSRWTSGWTEETG